MTPDHVDISIDWLPLSKHKVPTTPAELILNVRLSYANHALGRYRIRCRTAAAIKYVIRRVRSVVEELDGTVLVD